MVTNECKLRKIGKNTKCDVEETDTPFDTEAEAVEKASELGDGRLYIISGFANGLVFCLLGITAHTLRSAWSRKNDKRR